MESTRVNGGESGVGAKLAISIRAWLPGPKISPNNRNLLMTSSMSALISHFSSPPVYSRRDQGYFPSQLPNVFVGGVLFTIIYK